MDAERIASVLKKLSEDSTSLKIAVNALEREAPTKRERREKSPEDYDQLVSKYRKVQASMKGGGSSSSSATKTKKVLPYFSLNFARFRRQLKGLKKTTINTQVIGFMDDDTHESVIQKAAKGLGLQCDVELLQLACSNGLVPNSPIGDKPWSLGEYISNNGGKQSRCKKVWGIVIPIGIGEENATDDSGCHLSTSKYSSGSIQTFLSKKNEPAIECSEEKPGIEESGIRAEETTSSIEQLDMDPLELSRDGMLVKYSPVICGEISTRVVAIGQLGVWRCTQLDYILGDERAMDDMASEEYPFLPELHDFVVTEISQDSTCYFKVNMGNCLKKCRSEVVYELKEKRILRSKATQFFKPTERFIPLILVMPDHHAKAVYKWERKRNADWEVIKVPDDTCVMYTRSISLYKCTVATGQEFHFEVRGASESVPRDVTLVPMKELFFGKLIGQGSYGRVFKGSWNNTTVALKRIQLPPGSERSLLPSKEVEILKGLKHPNIINLLGFSRSLNEFVLITNFVKGKNLDQLVFSKCGAIELTDSDAMKIAQKVADAVHYMHSHSPVVIHQDLKPSNVLVSDNIKEVYVCDMGIAKVKEVTDVSVTCVSKGPGTFPYMAPEMFRESRRGTPVDVYSLGCLFIELFGRERVWGTLDGPSIMLKVLGSYNIPPQGPITTHLHKSFASLCSQMCDLDPQKRPNSKKVVDEIEVLSYFSDLSNNYKAKAS